MIHSLAGGALGEHKVFDFAKLEFDSVPNQFYWYISEINNLNVGDIVFAPFGMLDEPQKARVVKIDKNVDSTMAPISIKRAKKIIDLVK